MASVRGRISALMNSRIEAVTAIGGGGGAGGGTIEVPVDPGGGGGAAIPLSQTTESATLALHDSIRANMKPCGLLLWVATRMHLLSKLPG